MKGSIVASNDGRVEIQHYVPKFLLRGFLKDPPNKEQVHVFDKHEDRSFTTNIGNIAAERDFYDSDVEDNRGSLERSLSELEGHANQTIEKLVKTQNLSMLDDEQRSWLAIFVAVQQQRTRQVREVLRFLGDGIAEHIRCMGLDPLSIEELIPEDTEEDLKQAAIGSLLESIAPNTNLIMSKVCFLTATSPDNPFWISDHPVVMHNDRNFGPYGNIGLALPGIQVYLPLTSTLLLAMWCPTVADNMSENVKWAKARINELSDTGAVADGNQNHTIQSEISKCEAVLASGEPVLEALKNGAAVNATTQEVTFFNHLQVTWAHRHLFSSVDDFSLAMTMIADNSKYRKSFMPKLN